MLRHNVLLWGIWANSADPNQTSHYVASDQCRHCLFIKCSIGN